jgi:adenylosuccinate synthase
MDTVAIIGTQWGDEGKGKIVDTISENSNYCVRFQGGSNAGHTIIANNKTFKLRLTPSGVIQGAIGIVGSGCVVNLDVLEQEITNLELPKEKLLLDNKSTLILPLYLRIDSEREEKRNKPIGTTKNGIGVAYEQKASRSAFRAEDLKNPSVWVDKARGVVTRYFSDKEAMNREVDEIITYLSHHASFFKERIKDTGEILHQAFLRGERVVIEGAQGTLLDITHGTYPFVTSSTTISGGISAGIGCALPRNSEIIGVTKAYCTRVGAGEFPSEETGEIEKLLQTKGKEIGVVTGRRRRCGWLNLDELKYAHRLNGFTQIAITKVDVLDDFEQVKVLVDGEFVAFEGWENSSNATSYSDLHPNLKKYLSYIEGQVGVKIGIVSTGPRREDTIFV